MSSQTGVGGIWPAGRLGLLWLLLLMLQATTLRAWDANGMATVGDFVIDTTGTIVRYNGTASRLAIPETLTWTEFTKIPIPQITYYGCQVVGIGEEAFVNNHTLTEVRFPSTLTHIDRHAFLRTGLTSITIPDNVTQIGDEAFFWCNSLQRVTIGNGITTISPGAFALCPNLVYLTLPNTLKRIEAGAFSDCESLTGILLPASVEWVGDYAFYGCTSFSDVQSLASIPPALGRVAFGDPEFPLSLAPLNILMVPGGFVEDYEAIEQWRNFNHIGEIWVNVPSRFTATNGVITGYDGPGGSVEIPTTINGQRITGIGNLAFRNFMGSDSVGLLAVSIPAGVTSIANGAFYGCKDLMKLVFKAKDQLQSIGQNAFYTCTSLQTLTLPESLATIGSRAFYGCTSLQTLTLGTGLTSIGSMAFYGCPAVATLNSRSLIPPTLGTDAFGGYDFPAIGGISLDSCRLYVPTESGSAYNTANQWREFARLTADIPVGHDTIHADTTTVHDTVRIIVYDTTHIPDTVYDTTRIEVFDTTHTPVTVYDTTRIEVFDTTHTPVTVYDTTYDTTRIEVFDTTHTPVEVFDTTHTPIEVFDTTHTPLTVYDTSHIIIYDTTHAPLTVYDTTLIPVTAYDTTYTPVTAYDTTWRDTTYYIPRYRDTTLYYVRYDTTHTPVTVYDTTRYTITLTDTALVPDTLLVRDTIIRLQEVEVTVYIVIDQATAAQTVVSEEAHVNDAGDGIVLSDLTPNAPFAIYSTDGALVYRSTASPAGAATLRSLPPGTYLLHHSARWLKFIHK